MGPNFGEQRLPPTPSPTAGPSPTATPSAWPKLLLSEVLYDAPQEGSDSEFEWVEVYNAGDAAVSMADWAVADNGGQDRIPSFTLGPGEYLVIAATASGFAANYPGFAGNLVSLEGTIGNGLSNTGDVVRLLAPDGAEADAMSYGDNASAFAPPCPDVPAGQSLARVPSGSDTDTAVDWAPQPAPNPGGPGLAATPTPTPTLTLTPASGATGTSTPTPTPTGTPTATPIPTVAATPTPTATAGPLPLVRLNEILPRPEVIDWDGNGTADAYDEWIEVVNLGPEAVDLGGWALDDITGGGSAPYVFPAGTLLGPGEFLVRYRSTTRVALNQDADTANLLAPDGTVVDSFSYTNPRSDASYSRIVDGTGEWTDAYPPSPGQPNRPGTPTPTPTGTASPTATPIPTVTPTPTPTATIGPLPLIRLNEILPRPEAVDWDGNGTVDAYDEWVEVVNLGPEAVDMGGWALDDILAAAARRTSSPRARCWGQGNSWCATGR